MKPSPDMLRYVRLSRRLRSLYGRSAKALRQETIDQYEREIAELESTVASIALTELEYVEARAMIGPWS